MSQFQQQPIEYQAPRVFEQPVTPNVSVERAPILPTYTYQPGYSGYNWAEIGLMASKTGSNIYESALQYQVDSKQNAIQSIALETEDKLNEMYLRGASKDEIDTIKTDAATKMQTIVGVDKTDFDITTDITDPNAKEKLGSLGLAYQKLVLNGRKLVTGIDASNAQYLDNKKESDNANRVNGLAIQLQEYILENADKDPQGTQKEIDRVLGVLRTEAQVFIGDNQKLNADSISAIASPSDKDSAMRYYGTILDLMQLKEKLAVDMEKARAASFKDIEEQKKQEALALRERLQQANGQLEVIKKRVDGLKEKIDTGNLTAEENQILISAIQEQVELEQRIRGELTAYTAQTLGYSGRKSIPNPMWEGRSPTQKDLFMFPPIVDNGYFGTGDSVLYPDEDGFVDVYSPEFDSAVIGPLAVNNPELRTAFNNMKINAQDSRNAIGKTRINLITSAEKLMLDQVTARASRQETELRRNVGIAKSRDTLEVDRTNLGRSLNTYHQIALDDLIGYTDERVTRALIEENVGKPYIDPVTGQTKKIGTWEEETKNGMPFIRSQLNLDVPNDQLDFIRTVFGENTVGIKAWQKASETFLGMQKEIYGTDAGSSYTRRQTENDHTKVLFNLRQPTTNITAAGLEDAAVTRTLAVNNGNPIETIEDLRKVAPEINEKGGILPAQSLVVAPVFSVAYAKAQNREELISLLAQLSLKTPDGQILQSTEDWNWSDSEDYNSFPAIRIIVDDLSTKDPDSDEFKKAMVGFGFLPENVRRKIIAALPAGEQRILPEQLHEEMKFDKDKNIVTLISSSSENGVSASTLLAAKQEAKDYRGYALSSSVDPNIKLDPSVRLKREGIKTGVLDYLKQNPLADSGLIINPDTQVVNLNQAQKEAYGWIVEEAAKLYEVGLVRAGNKPEDSSKLMAASIKTATERWTKAYYIDRNGLRKRGNLKQDIRLNPNSDTSIANLVKPAFPNTSSFTTALDQDVSGWYFDRSAPPSYKNQNLAQRFARFNRMPEGTQYASDLLLPPPLARLANQTVGQFGLMRTVASKDQAFGNLVRGMDIGNNGVDSRALNTFAQLWGVTDENQYPAVYNELIQLARFRRDGIRENETTRREALVVAAVLKETALMANADEFSSKEEVVSFMQQKAVEIRTTLEENKDEAYKDSPYTLRLTSSAVGKENIPTIELLKRNPNGDFSVVSFMVDDLANDVPGYQTRGIADPKNIILSVGTSEEDSKIQFLTLPKEPLIAKLQKLVDKGLLVDGVTAIKVAESPDFRQRAVLPQFSGQRDYMGAEPYIRVTVKDGKVSLNRWWKKQNESPLPPQQVKQTTVKEPKQTIVEEQKQTIVEELRNPLEENIQGALDIVNETFDPREAFYSELDRKEEQRIAEEMKKPTLSQQLVDQKNKEQVKSFVEGWDKQLKKEKNQKETEESKDAFVEYWLTSVPVENRGELKTEEDVLRWRYGGTGRLNDNTGERIQPIELKYDYWKAWKDGVVPDKNGRLPSRYKVEYSNLGYKPKFTSAAESAGSYGEGTTRILASARGMTQDTLVEETVEKDAVEKLGVIPEEEIGRAKKGDLVLIDNIVFRYEDNKSLKQIYIDIYGEAGAELRMSQARERQQQSPETRRLAIMPDYSNTQENPIFRYAGPEGMDLSGLEGFVLTKEKSQDRILGLSRNAGKEVLLHEGTHMSQPARVGGGVSTMFTQEEFDKMSDDQTYALSKREIPAWFAELKARYYVETKNELLPNSPEEKYNDFISWLKVRANNTESKTAKWEKILLELLTESNDEIKTMANEVLRQVATISREEDILL